MTFSSISPSKTIETSLPPAFLLPLLLLLPPILRRASLPTKKIFPVQLMRRPCSDFMETIHRDVTQTASFKFQDHNQLMNLDVSGDDGRGKNADEEYEDIVPGLQCKIVMPLFRYQIKDQLKLMNFLSNILGEEGGFEYKKAIVDSIMILIRDIPDSKDSRLLHLCEFIEDCEFTYLSTRILHFLGVEGPKTSDPSKYISLEIRNDVDIFYSCSIPSLAQTPGNRNGYNNPEEFGVKVQAFVEGGYKLHFVVKDDTGMTTCVILHKLAERMVDSSTLKLLKKVIRILMSFPVKSFNFVNDVSLLDELDDEIEDQQSPVTISATKRRKIIIDDENESSGGATS
ncbi:Armadillo-like helical [Cynara cardunculus var. scolymus]|uniref:Armadillo-like helical n=1 Tax=Cynara cardunculus var. scolymus TaxID=59895 RepID=A0A103XTW6_CYNCS|nr:Armadillo-like helical [Cynara cardunculus var. scolymus]